MNPRLISFCLALSVGLPAHAANGIDEDKIEYHDWGGAKPNVVTFVSSKMPRLFKIIWKFNTAWLDMRGQPVESMQAHVCATINRSLGDKCTGPETPALLIREAFLGNADDFKNHPSAHVKSNDRVIGIDQLAELPPGARRVIQLAVMEPNEIRTVISVAYDDIPDDDLRMIALEEGIYRVTRWRTD